MTPLAQQTLTWNDFLAWEATTYDVIDVKRIYVDIAGDLVAGILLSQIVWHYLPTKNGMPKQYGFIENRGLWYLAIQRSDWWDECRITPKQFDRALGLLIGKGLLKKRTIQKDGKTVVGICLHSERLMQRVKALLPKGENRNAQEIARISNGCDAEIHVNTDANRNFPKGKTGIDEREIPLSLLDPDLDLLRSKEGEREDARDIDVEVEDGSSFGVENSSNGVEKASAESTSVQKASAVPMSTNGTAPVPVPLQVSSNPFLTQAIPAVDLSTTTLQQDPAFLKTTPVTQALDVFAEVTGVRPNGHQHLTAFMAQYDLETLRTWLEFHHQVLYCDDDGSMTVKGRAWLSSPKTVCSPAHVEAYMATCQEWAVQGKLPQRKKGIAPPKHQVAFEDSIMATPEFQQERQRLQEEMYGKRTV